jgi:hypothetical protein
MHVLSRLCQPDPALAVQFSNSTSTAHPYGHADRVHSAHTGAAYHSHVYALANRDADFQSDAVGHFYCTFFSNLHGDSHFSTATDRNNAAQPLFHLDQYTSAQWDADSDPYGSSSGHCHADRDVCTFSNAHRSTDRNTHRSTDRNTHVRATTVRDTSCDVYGHGAATQFSHRPSFAYCWLGRGAPQARMWFASSVPV